MSGLRAKGIKKRTIIINISSIWYNVCRTLGNDKS